VRVTVEDSSAELGTVSPCWNVLLEVKDVSSEWSWGACLLCLIACVCAIDGVCGRNGDGEARRDQRQDDNEGAKHLEKRRRLLYF